MLALAFYFYMFVCICLSVFKMFKYWSKTANKVFMNIWIVLRIWIRLDMFAWLS